VAHPFDEAPDWEVRPGCSTAAGFETGIAMLSRNGSARRYDTVAAAPNKPPVPARSAVKRRPARILFVDTFTTPDGPSPQPSSDALGYGITAARVLRGGLATHGYDVARPEVRVGAVPAAAYRTAWTLACYDGVFRSLLADSPDLVFCFHAFGPFPAEIRRMALDLGLDIPIIGYTHGSHWDPTDVFRVERYPGMHLVDLANLHVMDRVLVVSHHFRRVLEAEIGMLSRNVAAELAGKMEVVGLPLDTAFIDSCRTDSRFERPTIVWNHAPIASKNPALFLEAIDQIMQERDVTVLMTRRWPPSDTLERLRDREGSRVVLGDDLPLDEYYRLLWSADIQVSTAAHETLGVATIEAMYTHNYCVVPRSGSYPEVLGADYEGLYDGTRSELVERIRRALDDPARRTTVGRQLARSALRYSPAAVVGALAIVVADVLERWPSRLRNRSLE
jgi:glycosyltransferase involved in cell wall biosynthesis